MGISYHNYKIDMYLLSKVATYVFILDVFWFKYAYFESSYILYGTAAIAFFIMAIDMIQNKISFAEIPYGVTINAIMCIYSLLTGLFVAKDTGLLLSSLKTYAVYSLFCINICYISAKEGNVDWIMKALVLSAMLCGVYTTFWGTYVPGYGYVISKGMNPNNLGLIFILGICGVVFLSKQNPKHFYISGAFLVFLYWRIMECGSRKSLLAGLVLIIVWLITNMHSMMKEKGKNKFIWLLLGAFIVLLISIYFINIYTGTDSFVRMSLLGSSKEDSSVMRKYYYELAIECFLNNPIIGIGFNQFQLYSTTGLFSHSLYAESISCWGIIGCLLYYPIYLYGINRSFQIGFVNKKDNKGKIVFVFFLVELFLGIGQVLYYEISHLVLLTVMFAWIANYQNYQNEKNIDKRRVGDEKHGYSKYIKSIGS